MFYKVTYHIFLSDDVGIRVTKHFFKYDDLYEYESEILSKFKGYARSKISVVTLD